MKKGIIILKCRCGYEDSVKTEGICPMCGNEMKLEFKETKEEIKEIKERIHYD
jgi:transcription initiation factor IIE alpha subunit